MLRGRLKLAFAILVTMFFVLSGGLIGVFALIGSADAIFIRYRSIPSFLVMYVFLLILASKGMAGFLIRIMHDSIMGGQHEKT